MKTLFSKPVNVSERVRRDFIAPSHAGFSTIEILIAFAVGIIFLTAAMMVAFSDPTLARQISLDSGQTAALDAALDDSGLNRAANKIGRAIEELTRNWNYSGAAIQNDATAISSLVTYANTASVVDISPCVKEVVNKTTWNTLNSRDRYITFGTAISDMDVAQALGPGGCDPTPPGDWDNPESFSSTDVSAVKANTVDAVHFQNKTIVVLGSTAGAPAKHDLYVFDLSAPDSPIQKGSLNVIGKGINDLVVVGRYVYAVRDDSTNQLVVIDINDLNTPTLVTSRTLTGVSGANPEGQAIDYHDGHLYVGTWNNNVPAGTPEFIVFDISDPIDPVQKGGYNLGHSVNEIRVQGEYAYLATTDNTGELTVMDVSDPSSPVIESKFDVALSSRDAESIYILGRNAYLGLTKSATLDDLVKLDISNLSSITRLGGINLNMNGASAAVMSIMVQGRFAFVGTSDTNDEFRVLDITGPNPVPYGCPPYNYSAHISELTYADGYVFAANESNATLRVIHDDPIPGCH